MPPADYMVAAYAITTLLLAGFVAATWLRARRTRRALAQQQATARP